jgi:hypothetical protein
MNSMRASNPFRCPEKDLLLNVSPFSYSEYLFNRSARVPVCIQKGGYQNHKNIKIVPLLQLVSAGAYKNQQTT